MTPITDRYGYTTSGAANARLTGISLHEPSLRQIARSCASPLVEKQFDRVVACRHAPADPCAFSNCFTASPRTPDTMGQGKTRRVTFSIVGLRRYRIASCEIRAEGLDSGAGCCSNDTDRAGKPDGVRRRRAYIRNRRYARNRGSHGHC